MATSITRAQRQKGKGLGRTSRTISPIRIPTAADWYWAAGFFEGEGNATFNAGSECASANQQNKEPLIRFQECFGGTLTQRISGARGRPIWVWRVYGARARGFLMSIFGLLSAHRQEQARLTLKGEKFTWRRP